MVAPIVGAVVRTTGGLVLRRVAATSMGNALTGLGTSFMLAERFSDNNGNVYELVGQESPSRGRAFTAAQISSVAPKKKRKVSAYQKRFGVEMKRLIKAHPRTPRTRLMKRAHTATKKAMKK